MHPLKLFESLNGVKAMLRIDGSSLGIGLPENCFLCRKFINGKPRWGIKYVAENFVAISGNNYLREIASEPVSLFWMKALLVSSQRT